MNKKMKHYEEGGDVEFETKQGRNEGASIDDDVRARAMAAIAAGGQKDEEVTVPKKTAAKLTPKATPKAEAPTPKAAPKAEPYKEKSGFEAKKAKALEGVTVKPTPKVEPKPIPVAKGNLEKSGFELKKEKAMGYKMGGKVSSASKRADGCAIRGKTRA
jgi:hypothetical protein